MNGYMQNVHKGDKTNQYRNYPNKHPIDLYRHLNSFILYFAVNIPDFIERTTAKIFANFNAMNCYQISNNFRIKKNTKDIRKLNYLTLISKGIKEDCT